MSDAGERQQIVDVLAAKYPIFPRSTIDRLVNAELDTYRTAKIHAFVPVLVQRAVGSRLQDADSLPTAPAPAPPTADLRDADRTAARSAR